MYKLTTAVLLLSWTFLIVTIFVKDPNIIDIEVKVTNLPFKSNTVSYLVLYPAMVIIPLIIVLLTCKARTPLGKKRRNIFLYVLFTNSFLTAVIGELLKILICKRRPDYDARMVKYEQEKKDGMSTKAFFTQQEATRSFPSGHTIAAAMNMLPVTYYLYDETQMPLVAAGNFLVYMGLLIFVCVTRVSDNRHDWTDVGAGVDIGLLVPIGVTVVLARYLRKLEQNERKTDVLYNL